MKSNQEFCRTGFLFTFLILPCLFSCQSKHNSISSVKEDSSSSTYEDTICVSFATNYVEKYCNTFNYPNYGRVNNSNFDSLPIPVSFIQFFDNLANQNGLFKGSDRVVWIQFAVCDNMIKPYLVAQTESGSNYYDLTNNVNGQPNQLPANSALNDIQAFTSVHANIIQNEIPDTTNKFCLVSINGFRIKYKDLKQIAKLNYAPNNPVAIVLGIKPCCEAAALSTIDLFIRCKVAQSPDNLDQTGGDVYFDFTLPCPNYCP